MPDKTWPLDEPTIDRLAKRLCEVMEHLDPIGKEWESLDEHDRAFYRVCVEQLAAELYPRPLDTGG